MKNLMQPQILNISELAHIKLEKLFDNEFTQIRDRLFNENHFDLFVTEIAGKMNFPAEFIALAGLLRDKTLAFNPDEMQDEILRSEERNDIADIAYALLQYWSGLGDDLFPPYLKGVVEMKLFYKQLAGE